MLGRLIDPWYVKDDSWESNTLRKIFVFVVFVHVATDKKLPDFRNQRHEELGVMT